MPITKTARLAARLPGSVRVILTPAMADALARRARRNDRVPWLEAGRIVRETLIRDGDLPDSEDPGR